MEVAEGVFQSKVPRPANLNVPDEGLRYTFVYAVGTDERGVLIDADENTDEGFRALRDQMFEAGVAPHNVSPIVPTHGHPDHAGLGNRIKKLTGARGAMHRQDAPGGRFPRWV